MKRRIVSILLSVTMCLTPAAHVGAAEFSSGVLEETAVEEPAAEETAAEETTGAAADPFGEVFTSGETGETEEPTAQAEETELFGDGAAVVENPEEPAAQDTLPLEQKKVKVVNNMENPEIPEISVKETDWIEENGRFRLVKPAMEAVEQQTEAIQAEEAQAEQPQPMTEELPAQEQVAAVQLFTAEIPAEEEISSEEETPAEEEAPSEEEAPAEGEVPSEEETPAEGEVPSEEEAPAEEEVPSEEEAPAEEEVPSEEEAPAEEEIPSEEEAPAEENQPTEEAAPAFYDVEDSLVLVHTTNDAGSTHSGYYLFDAEGYMVTGEETTLENEKYYFIEEEAATVYAECTGASITPATSNVGRVARDYWKWSSTRFVYYGSDGQAVSDITGLKKPNGFYAIDSGYYNLKNDGTPIAGDVTKDGKSYYFTSNREADGRYGKMVAGSWLSQENNNRWRYFNDDGTWRKNGIHVTRLGSNMGNDLYLLDAEGRLIRNRVATASNNVIYGANGSGKIYRNGPAKIGGIYYYFDGNGVAQRDKLIEYKGKRYYFTADGTRATWRKQWHWCEGAGRYYYFGSNPGVVSEKSGWRKLKDEKGEFLGWLYFKKRGKYYDHYVNQKVGKYYFTEDGTLASGVEKIGRKYYFFTESTKKKRRSSIVKKQLISWKGDLYYANGSGRLYTKGWKKLSGSYYYFQKDGKALKNAFISRKGENGYLDSMGKFTTGWVVINNAKNRVRYLTPDKKGYLKNCTKVIDGKTYTFDSKGYRVNDLSKKYRGPYYFEVDRVNGVMTAYTNSSKRIPVKSIRVSVGLPGTATPTGTYGMTPSLRWQPLMGPSWGQYGTHVDGAGQGGIFIHSVSGPYTNIHSVPRGEYEKLGQPASHGCIRACVADAKWVYNNSRGGTIRIFDGKYNSVDALKGPLGKPALKPMKKPYNTDPTDPLA